MGIFRAGVRVTRALTPTPSSSSSDDEDPRAKKKCKTSRSTEKVSRVGAHYSTDKDDIFQVAGSNCQLPEQLFELSHLGDVLSLETWNSCLSEEERQMLCAYLPDMEQDSFRKTLRELFGRQNMYFGSPLEVLWQSLKEGLCDPNVVKSREALMFLQRKNYYHDLREYHNGMVNSLVEMRELWSSDPEANIEEKLKAWCGWKSSEARLNASESMRASTGRLKMKSLAGPSGIIDDTVTRLGTPLSDSAHWLSNNAEKHLHLETRHNLEDSKIQEAVEKGKSHLDAPPAALANPYELDRMKKQRNISTYIKPKKEFDYRETGHKMLAEELELGSPVKVYSTSSINMQKSRRKAEQESKHNRHSREVKAHALCEDEDALPLSLVKAQHDGYMGIGFKGSEIGGKEMNTGSYMKKGNNRVFDIKLASSTEQEQLSDDRATYGEAAFTPPLVEGSLFSTLHFFSAVRAVLVDGYTPGREEIEWSPFTEIVKRVRACPGDPRILEVQLPLDGLVKGVLKVLSFPSKKLAMYKPFVAYDKSIRCWSWIGPVTGQCHALQGVDVRLFPEMWHTPAAILHELQAAFEKWLKNTEKTLHQLWQLALLPLPAYPVLPDEPERFRDLRAQKSLTTIFPSSYEMRSLFRKEECVRYSALEIAFRYTTADGHKSAVAPLRRMGAKSKAKARDHFMLKPDRPSHITVLCLVRDAAARLPQSIGTRADVCILLRDSQFIVEDVPELQLSQVVSGALDRLHYERDPCVRYDSDKKLWLYLHGDREEEDFDEGGTTSTRSSRRSKKDGAEAAALPAQGNGYNDDMSEPEPDSGLFRGNGGARESASPELLYDHQNGGPSSMVPGAPSGHTREEVLLQFIDLPSSMQPYCGNMQSHPMGWEVYKAGKELSITQ